MKGVVLGLFAISLMALFIGFSPQDQPRTGGFPRFDRQQDSTRMAKLNAEIDQRLEELKKQIVGKEEMMAPRGLQEYPVSSTAQIHGRRDENGNLVPFPWRRLRSLSCYGQMGQGRQRREAGNARYG